MADRRAKTFTIHLLVAWFVYPLLFGTVGLFWGALRPPLHLKGPDWLEPAVVSAIGLGVGIFLATLHSALSYRKLYLR